MSIIRATTQMPREVSRRLSARELFLVFDDDETAESFTEWLDSGEGWDAFERWNEME